MDSISLTSQISKNQQTVFTHLDDDMIIMGPQDGQYYGVNVVGADIWSLLDAGDVSLQTICDQILKKYDVEEKQCIAEVTDFIQAMVAQDMIRVVE